MNKMTIIGIVLAACIIVTDRFITPLPEIPAQLLYTAAVILIIAGMIRSRKEKV